MKPLKSITSLELRNEIEKVIHDDIDAEDLNQDSPYSISLPLQDWKYLVKCLWILERFYNKEAK